MSHLLEQGLPISSSLIYVFTLIIYNYFNLIVDVTSSHDITAGGSQIDCHSKMWVLVLISLRTTGLAYSVSKSESTDSLHYHQPRGLISQEILQAP